MLADVPDFDTPDLARVVEALTPDAVDALPFGCTRIDADGLVVVYNDAERRQSGSGERARVGLNFSTQVAPCMDTPAFRGRIEKAMRAGRLDLEFGWIGDFSNAQQSLRVRVQSATGGGCWLFLERV